MKAYFLVKSGNLVIKIRHQNERREKQIFKCDSHFFDAEKQVLLSNHPDYDELISIFLDYKQKAKIACLKSKSVDFVFNEVFKNEKVNSFFEFWKLLIARLQEEVDFFEKKQNIVNRNKAAGNLMVYKNVFNQFSIFTRDFSFDDLTKDKLIAYRNFMKMKNLSKSTIHQYLRTIRAVYNKGVLEFNLEDKKPFIGIFSGLKTTSFNSKKKYLTEDSILKLECFKGVKSHNEMVSLFLLQFYLGGIDMVDLYFAKKNQLKNDRFYFQRGKNDNDLLIDVKIFEKAKTFFEKFESKNDYIFPFRKDLNGYKTFRSRYLKKLKEVQSILQIEVLPIGGNLGVKIARHTFANIAKNKNVHEDIIREIMGHQRDDIDNYYKDKFPQSLRDSEHYRIIYFD